MTTPANLTERHYAEQALLAAVVAEREAYHGADNIGEWSDANQALIAAMDRYYAAVQATGRTTDPAVENIAEAGTFEVHDCPGGAYIITGPEPHDPDDQYDSGYIAHPAAADGRAADEFYGRDA